MKKIGIILVMTMLIVGLGAMSVTAKPRGCVINSDTDMLYYDGSGAGSLSVSWMEHFLGWWEGYDNSIQSQGISGFEIDDCDLTSFDDLDLYIQPGGNAYLQQKSIGDDGKAIINDWINNGGAYFGVCAGWYYASADYFWQDSYYDHTNLLGAYPVTTEGSIREIADYDESPGYAMSMLDNGFNTLYYGGPTIGYEYTSTIAGIVDSRHSYRDLPAVVKYNNMLLTSVHLEAFENDGFIGLSTEDRIENYKYLANLINEVAGTNYYVPAYINPPGPKACEDGLDNDGDLLIDMDDPGCDSPTDDDETDTVPTACNDGIDNDGDQLIDFPADPGCVSSEDDDETDSTGPVTLVDDGFESGLGDWSIYGEVINNWQQRNDEVYSGSYSAGLKQTGVSDYAYMETSFDASGYTTVTFDYVRMLKGLDTGDDFTAEYFDGLWYYVEHLDTGRENGDFVSKSFSIPNTATAVRFGCECGAVSEGCWVDDVSIVGE